MAGADDKETLKIADAETYATGLKTIPGITKKYIEKKQFTKNHIQAYFTNIIKLVAPWCCNADTQKKYKTFEPDKKGLAMRSMTKMHKDLCDLRENAMAGKPLFASLSKFVKDVGKVSEAAGSESSESFMRHAQIPELLYAGSDIANSVLTSVFYYLRCIENKSMLKIEASFKDKPSVNKISYERPPENLDKLVAAVFKATPHKED